MEYTVFILTYSSSLSKRPSDLFGVKKWPNAMKGGSRTPDVPVFVQRDCLKYVSYRTRELSDRNKKVSPITECWNNFENVPDSERILIRTFFFFVLISLFLFL